MEPKFTEEQVEFIRQLLTLPCCHTSGTHDPTHFKERRYVCESQKRNAFDRFCAHFGFFPDQKSDPACGWCSEDPKLYPGRTALALKGYDVILKCYDDACPPTRMPWTTFAERSGRWVCSGCGKPSSFCVDPHIHELVPHGEETEAQGE